MAQAPPERVGGGGTRRARSALSSTADTHLPRGGSAAAPERAWRRGRPGAVAAALIVLAGPGLAAPSADPQGVWMVEDEVALAVARCGAGALCGRVVWLRSPRDGAGRPKRDAMNPDAALRGRPLCGLTVLDGLLPVPGEPGRWAAGSFYDPRTGRGYDLMATLASADVLVARVYVGMPFLGKDQTLRRVRRTGGEGWC